MADVVPFIAFDSSQSAIQDNDGYTLQQYDNYISVRFNKSIFVPKKMKLVCISHPLLKSDEIFLFRFGSYGEFVIHSEKIVIDTIDMSSTTGNSISRSVDISISTIGHESMERIIDGKLQFVIQFIY